MKNFLSQHHSCFSVAALALTLAICAAGSLAQSSPVVTLPGAGQAQHDLQQAATPMASLAMPRRDSELATDAGGMGDIKFQVRSITINGNLALSTGELQLLVTGMAGSERSLRQLNAAARRITTYYRERGFATAKAYLASQDITDGVVSILVAEGPLVSHTRHSRPLALNQSAGAYLGDIKDGDTMEPRQGDRGLMLLHLLRFQR